MATSLDPMPRVCFEFRVEKILNASGDGSYQVQWAPSWVNILHLVGCDHLIQEFLQQQQSDRRDIEHAPGQPHVEECHQQLPSELLMKPDPDNQFGTQVVMRYVDDDNSEIDVEMMLPPGIDAAFCENMQPVEENTAERDTTDIPTNDLTELNHYDDRSLENDTGSDATSKSTSAALESTSDIETTLTHSISTNDFVQQKEQSKSSNIQMEGADSVIPSEELVMNMYSLRHLTEPKDTDVTTSRNLSPTDTIDKSCTSTCTPTCTSTGTSTALESMVDSNTDNTDNITCASTDNVAQQQEQQQEQLSSSNIQIERADSFVPSEEVFMNSDSLQGKDRSPPSNVVNALRKGDRRYHIRRPRKSIRLDNHRQILNTHKYKSYSCSSCGFTCFRRTDKSFPCARCGSKCTAVSNNNDTVQLGKESKSYSCDICKKSFARKNNLKQHMLLHTRKKQLNEDLQRAKGTKAYPCDICKKSFTRKDTLKLHLRLHSIKKPLKCKRSVKCKKPIKCKRPVQGKKPFKCYECGKLFNNRSHLAEHINVHTGERPFVCEICGKGFKAGSGLRSHKITQGCSVDSKALQKKGLRLKYRMDT